MSGPRSRSPRSRRLLWDKPDFDSHRVLSELDGTPLDRSHRSRDVPEEHFFRDPMREEQVREGQRRSPYFPEDRHFRNQNLSKEEELYRHRRRDVLGHVDDTGGDGGRHRGGFREQLRSFETRGRSPYSPLRKGRERSLLTSHSHSDHQQRRMEMGWRREEQERGGGRFRDISPAARLDDKRWGTGRERQGRRDPQGLNRDRRREEPHQRETLSERNPPAKRQRRDVDGANHLGYRNEENFGDRCYSLDTARDGFVGDRQGSLPRVDTLNTEPLIIEHDHGITDSRVLPRWDQFEKRGGLEPDLERRRIPRLMGSSQELLRTSNNKLELHEDTRRFHIQDNLRNANNLNTRRSPVQQDRQIPVRPGNRDGPTSQKGRTGPQPARERLNYGQDGRTGLPKNQPRFQQGHQDPPHEEQIPGYRSLREESYVEPDEQGRHWAEEQRHDGSGSVDRLPPRMNLDPKMPRQRQHGWNDLKMNNMTVVTEETLTVKVDMSRPVNQNSSLCYSSDRQLSLDLVNVGRQRLDFLPMLEHSGTYRESTMHTGTFAQEIITLVHQVKEQYFRGDGITLNERFSAPQKGSFSEEETVELTLNQRFSANRGFSLNSTSVPDDNVPLFSRLGPIQDLNQLLVRDPGDLRHNLERRRQERLEGVKVTIQGTSTSVRGMDPVRELEDSDGGDLAQMEGGEFSILLQEQNRRQELNMAQRRAAPLQMNSGPEHKDNRGRKQRGLMRRKNTRNNLTGPNW